MRVESVVADEQVRRLAAGIDGPSAVSPTARKLAEFVASAAGPAALALIHYGSHAQRSDAQPESAYDFFLIVSDYLEAYRSMHTRLGTSYRPRWAALLNRVLAPNVVAIRRPGSPEVVAKVAVLSLDDFGRATSARPRDHFVVGRLFQRVQVAWARDDGSRSTVLDGLAAIRVRTVEWGGPYLPAVFDAALYCERLVRRSYDAEIRPEEPGRVSAVLAAQRSALVQEYDTLLQRLAALGVVMSVDGGGRYALSRPVGRWRRWRRDAYFLRSEWRAIARWLKYIALYEAWPDYLVQKIARREGRAIALSERERRYPLVFLWPKIIRYLRSRPLRPRPRR